MRDRIEIKSAAKSAFTSQYGITIGTFILYLLAVSAASSMTAGIGAIIVAPPLLVGYTYFCLKIWRGEKGDIGDAFSFAFRDFGRNLGGVLWMQLFIFLWSLCFIIPGIVKGYAYSMTPYLLADTKVEATEALKISMRMTKGYKLDIFVLQLSFFGWMLLSVLTCGILQYLYVSPYMQISMAGMYETLKQNALDTGVVSAEELGILQPAAEG
ncbi:MAG: DUF975 family protein [Saccharofermentanales bacterium]